jgi:hypothetical protein
MRLRLGSIIALLLLAGLAAGFQLTGTEPARAQCAAIIPAIRGDAAC